MTKETIFITGIDTDAGKSYATGWLANYLSKQGRKVMTQKFIQTGNIGRSEDIELHRRIMGLSTDTEPYALTAPMIFSYPASPHLAARLDGREVDLEVIDRAREQLASQCDTLLVEGAGGAMVPISDSFLTIDYITTRKLDVALVTNGRLGSISHTLLSLEALASRKLNLRYLLYNTHFDNDPVISPDTRAFLRRHIERHYPNTIWLEIPSISDAVGV